MDWVVQGESIDDTASSGVAGTTSMDANVARIYVQARVEADRHKWIVSYHAQRDMGQQAVQEWVQQYWHQFLRARWAEHIQGKCYWMEFAQQCFGVLQNKKFANPVLVDRIIDRLEAGQENLDVILWARTWNLPMMHVLEILEAVDINSCRLSPHFVSHCA